VAEPTEARRVPVVADLTGTTVGRFYIRAKLGEGGMGQVYRAEDTRLKRPVALKRISPYLRNDEHYRRRFLKEAERASALSYDHIAGVYDVFEEGGEIFIVMEYVEGETLRHRLQQLFTVEEFLSIAEQCVAALQAAHAKGIAHRDLKPENIMLTSGGRAKVLDFGVAKLLPQARDQAATESLGSVGGEGFSGTVAYAAPEALMEQELDERADIFSLGVVFYEMLAGQHPFRVAGFTATTDRILHHVPEPLEQVNAAVPPELARIIHRMLAKEPAERHPNATELLDDLRRSQRHEAAPTPPRPAPRPAPSRFTPARAVAAVVTVALLVLGGYFVWKRWMAPPPERIRIVVLPFANRTGQPQLDAARWALTEVFISELTGSPNVQVLPYERLVELTRGLEAQGKDPSSEEGARIVGSYSKVQYVVAPSMLIVGSTARLQADFRNPQTGEALDNRRLERAQAGAAADTFYSMLSGLAGETQKYFKQVGAGRDYTPRPDASRPQTVVAAIRFSDGKKAYALGEYAAALKALEQAVQEDPQYALAHAWMGKIYGLLGYDDKARAAAERAAQLITGETPTIDTYFIEATLAERRYDFSAAQEKYLRLIQLFPDEPAWHISLADVYEKQGENPKAIASYQQALSLDPNSIVAYQELARLYGLARATREQALPEGQKALELYRALGHKEGEAATLLVLAEILRVKGDLPQARQQTESALSLYRSLGNEFGVIWATKTLGDISFSEGKYADARRQWQEVVSASGEVRNNRLVARALNNLGVAYVREGELTRGGEAFERSLEQQGIYGEYKDMPSLVDRAYALSNLGVLLVEYGPDPERGVGLIREALPIFERMENAWWIALNRQAIGLYYTNSGRYPEALQHYQQALALFKERGATERMALGTHQIGRLSFVQDKYESAYEVLLEALKLAQESEDEFRAADVRVHLGRTYLRLGDTAQAQALIQEGLQQAQRNKFGEILPFAFNALGELDRGAGRRERARQHFQRASALWRDPYVFEASVEARSSLGLLEAESGNSQRALALCQEAVAQARRLKAVHTLARTLTNQARVHVLRKEHEQALSLLEEVAAMKSLGLEYRAQALFVRAQALDGLGKAKEAKAAHQQAREAALKLQESLRPEHRESFAARRDIQVLLR
jgi:serine/threonine-protein kinase